MNKYILYILGLVVFSSCNKMLDLDPLSDVTPEDYFNTENDLATFTINQYKFPTHGNGIGTFANDNHTDNQATANYDNRWVPGMWRVPEFITEYDWTSIRELNYFLEKTLPRWNGKKIQGSEENIKHYIGEAYFLRAYAYFDKLKKYGDCPIVDRTFANNVDELRAYAMRKPQNEVARFILSDLDSAILLLKSNPPSGKNRISKHAANLFKSRVALYEGSWLIYHQNTAFVPGGPEWPGKSSYPNFTINLEDEIDFFLTESMSSASEVADQIELVTNTKDNGYNSSENMYFTMFGTSNLENYTEVLLWRAYNPSLKISHNVPVIISNGGGNTGFTRAFVDNFLMANGLPIYATNSGYKGDKSIAATKEGRDNRVQLFIKAPGEIRTLETKDGNQNTFGTPNIIDAADNRSVTGYAIKKGLSYLSIENQAGLAKTGSIVFRASEAYLNYIEASYLKKNMIDSKSETYWKKIRNRAGVDSDLQKTINSTIMTEEAKNDWAAFSAGNILTDKTLYNIRRERRCELLAEGFRYDDLRRWRALDQLTTTPYIIEGFNLWDNNFENYKNTEGKSLLIEPENQGTPNVSSRSESKYLRPYRINTLSNTQIKDGYRWIYAHYLTPIPAPEFVASAVDGNIDKSTVYQNPGWSKLANSTPE